MYKTEVSKRALHVIRKGSVFIRLINYVYMFHNSIFGCVQFGQKRFMEKFFINIKDSYLQCVRFYKKMPRSPSGVVSDLLFFSYSEEHRQ